MIEQKLISESPSNIERELSDYLKTGWLIKFVTQSSTDRFTTITVLLERVK